MLGRIECARGGLDHASTDARKLAGVAAATFLCGF